MSVRAIVDGAVGLGRENGEHLAISKVRLNIKTANYLQLVRLQLQSLQQRRVELHREHRVWQSRCRLGLPKTAVGSAQSL